MKQILIAFILSFYSLVTVAQEFVPGQLLVQLRPSVAPDASWVSGFNDYNLTVLSCVSKSWNIWLIATKAGNEKHLMGQLATAPNVLVAQPNHYLQKRNTNPNDADFPSQWNMLNTGQNGYTVGIDINATKAWDITTGGLTALGDTIVIAIIDGGVDLLHHDLSFWKNTHEIPNNGIDDDHNGYIDDYNGWNANKHNDSLPVDLHGTHVSGIAGAIGNNTIGVTGVNWAVKIMPLSLFDYTESEVVEAYTYVYDQRRDYNQSGGTKGAFVVATNSSFGVDLGQPADYPLWCAMYDSMGKVGILNAGATTNSPVDVDAQGDIPSACPSNYLVTVTNLQGDGLRSPSSGYGLTTIDLEAPGTGIWSTTPGNNYGVESGTSMASPHVAGSIALLYAAACSRFIQVCYAHPDSAALLIKSYLLSSVDTMPDMVGQSVSGGRLDVYNSMLRLINDYCDTCINVSVITTNISCNGLRDGAAQVNITGGKAPYKILWVTGDSVNQISNLPVGSYHVQVTDSNGCKKTAYFAINQPAPIITGYTVTRANGNSANGAIATQIQGGTQPYTVTWSNHVSTQSLTGITSGTYYATVTDANHCIRFDTVVVGTDSSRGIYEANLAEGIKMYPNPTTGDVHIELPTQIFTGQIMVLNLLGETVYQKSIEMSAFNLALSALPKGVYLIQIKNHEVDWLKKLIRL